MPFEFDEHGRNDEYDATDGEATGEPGSRSRPRQLPVAQPGSAPLMGNADQIVAALLGKTVTPETPIQPPASMTPATAEEAVQMTSDSYMGEIDKRLEVAHCYREFLVNSWFDNPSEASRIAEFEIRAFVRERLGELMGIAATGGRRGAPSPLTEDEQKVLKVLATFTPEEITALKITATKLAAAMAIPSAPPTLKPQAPVGPPPKPTLAARPQSSPTPQPTADPRPRGPGRPPGSKNKPKPAAEEAEPVPAVRSDGTPILNAKGEQLMVKPQRRQHPANAIPFPTTNEEMSASLQSVSLRQEARLNANPVVGTLAAISKNS